MSEPDVKEYDVVQIDPEAQDVRPAFRGCFAVVTEPKSWGFQGYVQTVGETLDERGGQAYVRVKKGSYALVGAAEWVARSAAEEEEIPNE